VDTSLFWSRYSRLRTIDYSPQPELVFSASGLALRVPMQNANSGAGRSFGGEVWATMQLRRGWRLIPSYSYLNDDRWLPVPNANYATLWEQITADIRHQGAVRLQYDLARNWQIDLMARARSRDLAHSMPGVLLTDARLSWHPVHGTEFAFTLDNLTDRRVFETVSEGSTPAIPIRRLFLLQWTQRF
jgi:outer membrane receptor protein involved in Fe transport